MVYSVQDYTLIIPTKNEELTIGEVLDETLKVVPKEKILIVDGNSKDKTKSIILSKNIKIVEEEGIGKGSALRSASKFVKSKYLIFMDADGSHDPKDIPKMLLLLEKSNADMVVGSRMLGGSDELHGTLLNFAKNIGSGLIKLAINYRFKVNLTDSENGFRAIKTDVFKNLDLKSTDFDIEQEMVLKCLKKDYKILEIPSHEYERKAGNSKLSLFRIGYKFIWRLIINLI